MPKVLSIDIETYSDVDLFKSGVHAYAASPNFELLLFGYAYDGGEPHVIDIAQGEPIPAAILEDLFDPKIVKTAWNAAFERACLSAYLLRKGTLPHYLAPEQWQCSMVHSTYLGLPASLGQAAKVFGVDQQKDVAGSALIKYFCIPGKPSIFSPDGRNRPESAPKQWKKFVEYCAQDVRTEVALRAELIKRPMPDDEWEIWAIDQDVNDRGVKVDLGLVHNAIAFDEAEKSGLIEEARAITALENPNSVSQLRGWIEERTGRKVASLDKAAIGELLGGDLPPDVRLALELRSQLGKSSVAKYAAYEASACPDGRARGLLQFYGAARSGRWSGRRIQPQNLPRISMRDIDAARELMRSDSFELLGALYDEPSDVLSQLLRAAIIAEDGRYFLAADFSAIEARVLAWLANEEWVLDVFRGDGKIYEATAAQMFRVPIESIEKDSPLRQRGKVASLACIAEGELILTPSGLTPIEAITTDHLVWDGVEFVSHDGVVFKGSKDVIEYEGLTATADHLVWIEGESGPVQFGDAAARGARLVQSGNGRHPIRLGSDHISREALRSEGMGDPDGAHEMHGMRRRSMDGSIKPPTRIVEGVSSVLSAPQDPAMARSEAHGGQGAMREPEGPVIPQLRGPRDTFQFLECDRSGALVDRESRAFGSQLRDRSDQQQRALRARQYSDDDTGCQRIEPKVCPPPGMESRRMAICPDGGRAEAGGGNDERRDLGGRPQGGAREAEKLARHRGKARVFDILNAGPRNRFTASGKLVHNCGYGGGVGALVNMGALRAGLEERELQPIIDSWRASNPRIVALWRAANDAAIAAVKGETTTISSGLTFAPDGHSMRVDLPSGRSLYYAHARIEEDPKFGREGVTYSGLDGGKWGRVRTYGGKLVENITQAVARDCLAEALRRVAYHPDMPPIVMHVHDEIVCEVDRREWPDEAAARYMIERMMSAPMPWAPDLPLAAEAYTAPYFQ